MVDSLYIYVYIYIERTISSSVALILVPYCLPFLLQSSACFTPSADATSTAVDLQRFIEAQDGNGPGLVAGWRMSDCMRTSNSGQLASSLSFSTRRQPGIS